MKLIYDYQDKNKTRNRVPQRENLKIKNFSEALSRKTKCAIPCLSENEVVRHFSRLAKKNFSVDSNFYPLGSCTMKYNPKVTERIANLDGFLNTHPFYGYLNKSSDLFQGSAEVIFRLERLLSEICGMNAFTLQPCAGAHGEMTGIFIADAYHKKQSSKRKYIIVPDSAHGTNPASAGLCGYETLVVGSDKDGLMDMDKYIELISDEVALVMLTCPNTLGVFNPKIKDICDLAHEKGALVYYDGANLNAILGKLRPGDVGFDIVHVNLHKTFATPHGGGGPGSGPVGVTKELEEFLPVPRVIDDEGEYLMSFDFEESIGQVTAFYGNFAVALKAYAYIVMLGQEGLQRVSDAAVLNANYIRVALKNIIDLAYDKSCMHECVFSFENFLDKGLTAFDAAKFLIDKGIHPPTVYFPLIVKEAFMVEPTETESLETLDYFIEVMQEFVRLADEDPEYLKNCPHTTEYGHFDEAAAARKPILRWKPKMEEG